MIDISIVLPIHNESEAVEKIIGDIHCAMERTKYTYEIIVVDDKSTDNSVGILKRCKGACA